MYKGVNLQYNTLYILCSGTGSLPPMACTLSLPILYDWTAYVHHPMTRP